MRRGPEIPMRGGGEYDCFYWKRILCFLSRPGVSAKIKRGFRRRARRFSNRLAAKELEEMAEIIHPEDEPVRQIGCCLRCGMAVMNVPGCPNNPDKATEVRIGGHWGSTAYDGSDITGNFMWGLLCDGCFPAVEHRLHDGRGPDWPKQSFPSV